MTPRLRSAVAMGARTRKRGDGAGPVLGRPGRRLPGGAPAGEEGPRGRVRPEGRAPVRTAVTPRNK